MINHRILFANVLLASSVLAGVREITSLEEYIDAKKGTIVAMFTASWCGPCQHVKPYFTALSEEYDDITFCLIGCDDIDVALYDESVMGFPTFVCMHEGNEIGRFSGARSLGEMRQTIEQLKAAIGGESYGTTSGPVFLSVGDYYQAGYEAYAQLVACASKPELTLNELDLTMLSDVLEPLFVALHGQDEHKKAEAFVLYRSFAKGCLAALKTYIPHAEPHDSFIQHSINSAQRILIAKNFDEERQLIRTINRRATKMLQGISQEEEPVRFWQTLAKAGLIE